MDGGSVCPICFIQYTTDGSHRPVALKCGHLFGSECIEKWISTYKKTYCPTCSAPCRKIHMRTIYAARVEATDTQKERELIEKYIKETELRKELESEVFKLKSQLEVMKMVQKQNIPVSKQTSPTIFMHFSRYCKIHFFPDDSLVAFDSINQCVVVSCFKDAYFGLYKYALSDFSINSFIKFDQIVRDLKISPFSDGLCLVAHGSTVSLINLYTEAVVKSFSFQNNVSAVSFSHYREIVLVADMKGNFHTWNVTTSCITQTEVCSKNIHSISVSDGHVYVASVFEIYTSKSTDLANMEFIKISSDNTGMCSETESGLICTQLSSTDQHVLALFRDSEFTITGFLMGEKSLTFKPESKQLFRHRDCIFGGYVLVSDDFRNTIKVLDLNSLYTAYLYTFKEPVVGFCGDSNVFIVLTKKGMYIYDNK